MAKADDTTSKIDWIWLREALELAATSFGSEVSAKIQLTDWLAAGKLQWICMRWEGLDAEGIARLDRENSESIVFYIIPTVAYHNGDPRFWHANPNIVWEENGAREKAYGGARALSIKVSRTHLLALLPEEPREREEACAAPLVGSNNAAPAKRKAPTQTDRDRARGAILQFYPKDRYPSGVPDTVKPGVLHKAVADYLAEHEPAKHRLSVPSVRTVQRARHSL